MEVDVTASTRYFRTSQRRKAGARPHARLKPSLWQHDYLVLSGLGRSVSRLIAEAATGKSVAIDVGGGDSPYRSLLAGVYREVICLDLVAAPACRVVALADALPIRDDAVDLVLCTEVLEHCQRPQAVMNEIARVLRPSGAAIVSAPHVWFFHPHPDDFWRFTQQGLLRLGTEAGLESHRQLAHRGTGASVAQVVAFAAYGLLGRWGAPLYFILNVAGILADRLVPNDLFCLGFACLWRRRASVAVGW